MTKKNLKEKETEAPTGLLHLSFPLATFLFSIWHLNYFPLLLVFFPHLNICPSQGPLYLNSEVPRLLVDLRRRHRGQNRPGHNWRLLRADGRHPEVFGDGLHPFLPVTGLFIPVIVAFSPNVRAIYTFETSWFPFFGTENLTGIPVLILVFPLM